MTVPRGCGRGVAMADYRLQDPEKAVWSVHSAGGWTQEISLGRVGIYENRRQPFLQVALGHQNRIVIAPISL